MARGFFSSTCITWPHVFVAFNILLIELSFLAKSAVSKIVIEEKTVFRSMSSSASLTEFPEIFLGKHFAKKSRSRE